MTDRAREKGGLSRETETEIGRQLRREKAVNNPDDDGCYSSKRGIPTPQENKEKEEKEGGVW